MASRLQLLKPQIRQTLLDSGQTVFAEKDIRQFLFENRYPLSIPASVTVEKFLDFLVTNIGLEKIEFGSDRYPNFVRYVWRDDRPSVHAIALTLRPRAYLSHLSALQVHGVVPLSEEMIYVNAEQSEKPRRQIALRQEAIDRAFANRERSSNYVLSHEDCSIVLISGKCTDDFGVSIVASAAGKLRVTSPARTLVDSVVRPGYSGGVKTVARAFERLADRVKVKDLLAVLARLDHAYPYHQSVGFYMERAGFDRSALAPLRELGMSYDFHLAHAMKGTTRFDRKWRVRYPASLS